jgi:hypothetical protein
VIGRNGYARSAKNRVGLALAAVGPALVLAGVCPPLAGLALAPGLYAVGALYAPAAKPRELGAGVDAGAVQRSLEDVRLRVRGRVPVPVEARVRRITTTINEALPLADRLPPGGRARWSLARTATDYLPATLDAYLALPRPYAEREVVADGKTAAALLCDQLDVLAAQLGELVATIHRSDAEQLMANGRFLHDRFGATSVVPSVVPSSGSSSA